MFRSGRSVLKDFMVGNYSWRSWREVTGHCTRYHSRFGARCPALFFPRPAQILAGSVSGANKPGFGPHLRRFLHDILFTCTICLHWPAASLSTLRYSGYAYTFRNMMAISTPLTQCQNNSIWYICVQCRGSENHCSRCCSNIPGRINYITDPAYNAASERRPMCLELVSHDCEMGSRPSCTLKLQYGPWESAVALPAI
jgi:hypothetical protein